MKTLTYVLKLCSAMLIGFGIVDRITQAFLDANRSGFFAVIIFATRKFFNLSVFLIWLD